MSDDRHTAELRSLYGQANSGSTAEAVAALGLMLDARLQALTQAIMALNTVVQPHDLVIRTDEIKG